MISKSHPNRYQWSYNNFNLRVNDKVLDIGCGGDPLPQATTLLDISFETMSNRARQGRLRKDKQFVVANICQLPFKGKTYDFVYCSHVLEHVDNPIAACREIMRVGKRGYIETPTFGKDMLFAWAKGRHKWHVVAINEYLCFFEYSPRQLEGIKSQVWREDIFSSRSSPIKEIFFKNLDIFNVMFPWVDNFRVLLFCLNGSVEFLKAGKVESIM
jgi:ubiquinone/menaquinone biosynthesis C-methylase UbiE